MNVAERLFVNYNFVKGAQRFMKEAGFLKYANEQMEDIDANATAQALIDSGLEIPAEEAVDDNTILEVANTLVDLAQTQPSPAKEQVEQAAADVAKAVAPAGQEMSESEMGSEEKEEEEDESEAEEKLEEMQEEIKEGMEIATKIALAFAERNKRAADEEVTNAQPDQVLSPSGTDYQKATSSANAPGTGQTDLKTEMGEVGAQQNVESQIVQPKAPEANEIQKSEGEDIYKKDYSAPGKGETTLKTEMGEVGDQENVDSKLATIALQQNYQNLMKKINK